MAVRLQIGDEPADPRRPALRVGPHLNVLVDSFEYRAAEFECRVYFMDRFRPLNVERGVVLRQNAFAIRLLAHLDPADRVAALLEVRDLRGRIVGRSVEHGDRNHRGQVVGQAAGEEDVEAGVLAASRGVDVGRRMPGIDRRSGVSCLRCYRRECCRGVDRAGLEILNAVAHAIAYVVRTVQVAGVRRLRHPDAHESRCNGIRREFQVDGAAFAVLHRPAGKCLPLPVGRAAQRTLPHPVIHLVDLGVWVCPADLHRIETACRRAGPSLPIAGEACRSRRVNLLVRYG